MFTGGVNTNTLQTPNYNIIATSPIIRNMAPNQPVQVRMPCRHSAGSTSCPVLLLPPTGVEQLKWPDVAHGIARY